MSVIYMIKYEKLSLQEAAEIIRNPDLSKVTTLPACDPKCGQLFLYSYEGCQHKKDDWRCDQFQWVQKGRHLLPRKQPLIRKMYFQRLINGEAVMFHRYGYELPDGNVNRVVIHYLGKDDSPQPSVPHGNMKKYPTRSYIRTLPSVLKEAADQKYDHPFKIYQKQIAMSSASPGHVKVMLPKDVQQIRNKLKYERKKSRLSHDDLYVVFELLYALEGFICLYSLAPEICIVLALPEIIHIFEDVALQSKTTLLSYDTTFQLGDFYVSSLIFQCTYFEEKPAIPLAILIHDKRTVNVHETFFSFMGKHVPQINSDSTVIVTDREAAIMQGIEKGIPHCMHVLCWNHIIKDVEFWVSAHGGGKADRKVYCNNILQLLDCRSEKEFLEMLGKLKVKWSASFLGYFEQKLQKVLLTNSGRWLLEKRGLYKETSGITTNVSESMNAVFKRLCNQKEKNMDEMILAFYFLQTYYLKEILRGLCDIGNYHLSLEFLSRKLTPDDIQFPEDCVPLDKIVEVIKQRKLETKQEKPEVQRADRKSKTSEGLAHFMVTQNRVFLQAQSGCFIVRGLRGKEYVVRLFPSEVCSCNSSRTCYHIMAAQMGIGKSLHPTKLEYSLKKLRMNARKGKSGRKKPRQKDELSILAAPDSILLSGHDTTEVIPKEKLTTENKVGGNEREISSLGLDLEPELPCFSSTPKKASHHEIQISQCVPWDYVKDYPRMRSTYIRRVYIHAEDMKSLLNNNWLVDTVIEGFLITRTTMPIVATTDVDVTVFSPFIMRSMELHGYTTNVHNFGINFHVMARDIWLIPTNVHNSHWILMIVFFKWKIILYLDSNHGLSTNYTDMLQTFMEMQAESQINWSDWSIHAPLDIPVQNDSCNCGIFVCLFAHILCSGSAVPFPVDMVPVRQWIATELLKHNSVVQQQNVKQGNRLRTKKEIKQKVKSDFETPISRTAPKGTSSTIEFLSSAIQQYYSSSWSMCLMGDLCKKPKKDKMVLCQGMCQDWYHLSCLEITQVPHGVYQCPKCSKQ